MFNVSHKAPLSGNVEKIHILIHPLVSKRLTALVLRREGEISVIEDSSPCTHYSRYFNQKQRHLRTEWRYFKLDKPLRVPEGHFLALASSDCSLHFFYWLSAEGRESEISSYLHPSYNSQSFEIGSKVSLLSDTASVCFLYELIPDASEWSVEKHKLFPPSFKKVVIYLLWLKKTGFWTLPKPIMWMLINMM